MRYLVVLCMLAFVFSGCNMVRDFVSDGLLEVQDKIDSKLEAEGYAKPVDLKAVGSNVAIAVKEGVKGATADIMAGKKPSEAVVEHGIGVVLMGLISALGYGLYASKHWWQNAKKVDKLEAVKV